MQSMSPMEDVWVAANVPCFGTLLAEHDRLLRRKINHNEAASTSFTSIMDGFVFAVCK
jgi:hypothetical protein